MSNILNIGVNTELIIGELRNEVEILRTEVDHLYDILKSNGLITKEES